MKIQYLFLILIFSFSKKTFAQDEVEEKIPLYNSLHIYFSPEINNTTYSITNPDHQWIADTKAAKEIPTFSYSYGVTHSFDIDRLTSMEYGILYAIKRIRTQKEDLLWEATNLNPAGSIYRVYKYSQYQIPLRFNFKIGKKRNYFLSFGGFLNIHYQFEVNEMVILPNGEKEKRFLGNLGIERKNASPAFYFGVGREIPLYHNKLLARIAPYFTSSLSYLRSDFYNQNFFSLGINTSITINKLRKTRK